MTTERKDAGKRSLKVMLTRDDKLNYGENLAKLNQDKMEVESHKKEVTSDLGAKINGLASEIDIVSRKLGNGFEYRDIKCEWYFNWNENEKTRVRTDTGEVVETTDIQAHERQEKLDFDEEKSAEEGKSEGEPEGEPEEEPEEEPTH